MDKTNTRIIYLIKLNGTISQVDSINTNDKISGPTIHTKDLGIVSTFVFQYFDDCKLTKPFLDKVDILISECKRLINTKASWIASKLDADNVHIILGDCYFVVESNSDSVDQNQNHDQLHFAFASVFRSNMDFVHPKTLDYYDL